MASINCERGWAALETLSIPEVDFVFRQLHCFGSRKEDVWDRLLELYNSVQDYDHQPRLTRRQLQQKLRSRVKLVRAEISLLSDSPPLSCG